LAEHDFDFDFSKTVIPNNDKSKSDKIDIIEDILNAEEGSKKLKTKSDAINLNGNNKEDSDIVNIGKSTSPFTTKFKKKTNKKNITTIGMESFN